MKSLHRAVVMFVCLAALAQVRAQCTIPDPAIIAPVLDSGQQGEVRKCADENSKDLDSPEADKRQQARKAIVRPLENAQVSASFRIAYGNALNARLTALVQNPDDRIAALGLAVAGEIASESCAGIQLGALSSDRAALRFEAVYAMRRTFDATAAAGGAAVQAQTIERMIEALRERAKVEKDGLVLQAIVAALRSAPRVPIVQNAAGLSVQAIDAAISGNLKSRAGQFADPATNAAYLAAILAVRDIISDPNAKIDTATAKAAANLAGHIIAYPALSLQNKSLPAGPAGQRAEVGDACLAAQTVIRLVGVSLQPGFPEIKDTEGKPLDLKARLLVGTTNGDAEFVLNARLVSGSEGVLTKPPFALPAAFGLK